MRIIDDLDTIKPITESDKLTGCSIGQYNVIGSVDYNGVKCLAIKCTVCSKDKELYSQGVFAYTYADLRRGCMQCGCSRQPKWTKAQYEIRCKRKAKELGYEFLGFVDFDQHVKQKRKIKLQLSCPYHGTWGTASLFNFLNSVAGCYYCGKERVRDKLCKSRKEYTKTFMSTGKYLEGTVFNRIVEGGAQNSKWEVICPKCSEDEFVSQGLCTGKFKSRSSSLLYGNSPCRCSPVHKYTKEQREFQISKDKDHKFIRWLTEFTGSHTQFEYECPAGNTNITNYCNWSNSHRCTCCTEAGYSVNKPGSFYIVRWYDDSTSFLKFGITNREVIRRIREQANNTNFSYEILHDFRQEDGLFARRVESIVFRKVKTKVVCKELFPKGYTETCSEGDLDKILSVVEEVKKCRDKQRKMKRE